MLALLLGAATPAWAEDAVWHYTVRPGDTIWDLAHHYLADWRNWEAIQARNGIEEPRRLTPGSRLEIPVEWLRLEPVAATLAAAQGELSLQRGGTSRTVAVGDRLRIGDVLVTGETGSAVIRFADSSEVVLAGNSQLALDSLTRYHGTTMVDTRLRLQRGRLETVVQPATGGGSRFEIWTPPATSSVRGTDLRVGLDEAVERSTTEVLQGNVSVSAASTARAVAAGFGTVTRQGDPPAPPRPLLPPPPAGDVPDRLERLPLRLPMPALEGAQRFRLNLAADEDFQEFLVDQLVEPDGAARLELEDGTYAARLRGIDADGLEGQDLVWSLEIAARPEPPLPLEPQRDGQLREPLPRFGWSQPQDARAYRFALASDPDFSEPLIQRDDLAEPGFTPPTPLPLGDYYWRLATIDATGRIGPWGDPAQFAILAPPADPTIGELESDKGRLTIRLSALEPGQQLRFQLATDAAFTDVLADQTVTDPELVVPGMLPGDYWFRAQIIEPDGYVAPFGSPQRITVEPARWWPVLLVPIAMLFLLL